MREIEAGFVDSVAQRSAVSFHHRREERARTSLIRSRISFNRCAQILREMFPFALAHLDQLAEGAR
ncbi:MAG: hypothetical protein WKF47_06645 [Geodermatophilaceae bacterium]